MLYSQWCLFAVTVAADLVSKWWNGTTLIYELSFRGHVLWLNIFNKEKLSAECKYFITRVSGDFYGQPSEKVVHGEKLIWTIGYILVFKQRGMQAWSTWVLRI